jgi:hypothetical protein
MYGLQLQTAISFGAMIAVSVRASLALALVSFSFSGGSGSKARCHRPWVGAPLDSVGRHITYFSSYPPSIAVVTGRFAVNTTRSFARIKP